MAGLTLILAGLVAAWWPSWMAGAHTVSFHRDVQPIFNSECVSCHPIAYQYLDLRPGHSYSQLVGATPPNAPSYERVVPYRPDLSYLLIHPPDPSRRTLLTRAQGHLIARWILQGAPNN